MPRDNDQTVGRLQQDLRKLGFLIAPPPSGTFDLRTEWAVREFQIYAKMTHVAVGQDLNRLEQVATGAARYTGPVSGVVNQDTRAAIQHWLEKDWRCPVIISARTGPKHANVFDKRENIWLHNDVASDAPRMFARDFSGYYTFPSGRDPGQPIVLGDYAKYLEWEGPRSVPPRHTWSQGELLPEDLIGAGLSQLTASQLSTYKVVRAVSEVECLAYFDSLNCYDNAFISVGPCHWTLGIITGNQVDEGELGGYLSYLRHAEPQAFQQAFEFFGMRIDEDWVHNGVANGQNLKVSSARKYVGWPALQSEDFSFVRMPKDEAHGDYFKTWHWFYRFVMAGRTVKGYRQRMWHMARVRIRDIRAAGWLNIQPPVANATIGDVFTSERAMGIILRWHIRSPGSMVAGGRPGAQLRGALTRARSNASALNWNGDPGSWGNEHEAALVQGLMDEARANAAGYLDTLDAVNKWPTNRTNASRGYSLSPMIERLSNARNSLNFDGSDLPPAPSW